MYNMRVAMSVKIHIRADLIDDWPVKRSQRFIKMSWMR